jgi:hypothetical protein
VTLLGQRKKRPLSGKRAMETLWKRKLLRNEEQKPFAK